jgi:hypothetical protein
MYHDATRHDELNSTGAFQIRIGLTFIFGDTNVIPEMKITLFHVNQMAQSSEETGETFSIERLRITILQIEYQFFAVCVHG